jgi:hypothetical protein
VQREAVEDGRHGELAYAEVEVVAVVVGGRDRAGARVQGQVRAREVGGPADELRQHRRVSFQRVLGGLARRDALASGLDVAYEGIRVALPVAGQGPAHAPLEFRRELRVRGAVGIEAP